MRNNTTNWATMGTGAEGAATGELILFDYFKFLDIHNTIPRVTLLLKDSAREWDSVIESGGRLKDTWEISAQPIEREFFLCEEDPQAKVRNGFVLQLTQLIVLTLSVEHDVLTTIGTCWPRTTTTAAHQLNFNEHTYRSLARFLNCFLVISNERG